MHGHLVTVKVSVKRGANEWMQVDGFAFYQYWFERLDTQAVKRWCAVEQYWMFSDNFFQNIPYFRTLGFHHALGSFDGGSDTVNFEFGVNERFE